MVTGRSFIPWVAGAWLALGMGVLLDPAQGANYPGGYGPPAGGWQFPAPGPGALTMIPSLIVIGIGTDPLRILVLSQVSLSFQLPFALIPLVLFTSNPKIMGEFTNRRLTKFLAWLGTLIILALNVILLFQIFSGG